MTMAAETETHTTPELSVLDKIRALGRSPLFAKCKTEQLLELAAIAEVQRFAPGNVIFREHGPGDALYHVMQGAVRLRRPKAGFESVVRENESFGTLAMLDGSHRSVTATAEEPTVVLRIGRDEFYELMADHAEIVQGIVTVLVAELRRLRYSTMA